MTYWTLKMNLSDQERPCIKKKVFGIKDRGIPRKEKKPIILRHLAMMLEKRDGSLGNISFPYSLARFFSPFLSFSFPPPFSSSSPTKPRRSFRRWDPWLSTTSVHDDIVLFLSVFAFHHPSLFFSSSFFCFPIKLVRHHCGPLFGRRRHPRGNLASRHHGPVEPGRRTTLHGGFSYRGAIWGARSSRVVNPDA